MYICICKTEQTNSDFQITKVWKSVFFGCDINHFLMVQKVISDYFTKFHCIMYHVYLCFHLPNWFYCC